MTLTGRRRERSAEALLQVPFIGRQSAGTPRSCRSGTVGADRSSTRVIFSFTTPERYNLDWLPASPRRGAKVEVCRWSAIREVRGRQGGGKRAIYWDQASCWCRIGKLDPAGMSGGGRRGTAKVRDQQPAPNALMRRWAERRASRLGCGRGTQVCRVSSSHDGSSGTSMTRIGARALPW